MPLTTRIDPGSLADRKADINNLPDQRAAKRPPPMTTEEMQDKIEWLTDEVFHLRKRIREGGL